MWRAAQTLRSYFLHSVWTAFGRLIRDKIISAISMA
jgi:hypothetical protein